LTEEWQEISLEVRVLYQGEIAMADFLRESDFLGDSFSVPSNRVQPADLLGYGYFIPDFYWRAEMLLPETYKTRQLIFKKFWTAERQVSWPEVEMLLALDRHISPVGWRVVSHLYYQQDLLPVEWIECMLGGGMIVFPHAVCYWRGRDGQQPAVISCPAFFYEEGIIDCKGINRFNVAPTSHIALYQQG
jgi:hypothetical protein